MHMVIVKKQDTQEVQVVQREERRRPRDMTGLIDQLQDANPWRVAGPCAIWRDLPNSPRSHKRWSRILPPNSTLRCARHFHQPVPDRHGFGRQWPRALLAK